MYLKEGACYLPFPWEYDAARITPRPCWGFASAIKVLMAADYPDTMVVLLRQD